ncbi:MAG TPA: DNA-binding response regulator, partial [Sphingobacterium sp.]|nr:DNA-binding response regulator [Sphingobacterium sp.]
VNKSTAMAELSNAILTIRERGKYMSDEVKDLYVKKLTQSKSKLNTMNPLSRLSNREVDVAKYLIQGHGIIEVSTTLDLSPSTVSTYKSRIFEKLNVSNIPELIEIFRIHSAN